MNVSANAMTQSLFGGLQSLEMQSHEVALVKKVGVSLIGLLVGEIAGSHLGKSITKFRFLERVGKIAHPILASICEMSFYAKLAACTIIIPMKSQREFSQKSSILLMVGLGALSGVSNMLVRYFAEDHTAAHKPHLGRF